MHFAMLFSVLFCTDPRRSHLFPPLPVACNHFSKKKNSCSPTEKDPYYKIWLKVFFFFFVSLSRRGGDSDRHINIVSDSCCYARAPPEPGTATNCLCCSACKCWYFVPFHCLSLSRSDDLVALLGCLTIPRDLCSLCTILG